MAPFGKTHIYAVAREGQSNSAQSELHEYHKSPPTWTLMLEEHHLLGKNKVTEYAASWDEGQGHHKVHALDLGSHDSILGSILISDTSSLSHSKAEANLNARGTDHALDADSNSEDWLRHALRAWQQDGILNSFDIAAFFTFAHSYIANRQTEGSDTPATIAYPALHPAHEEKAKQKGFWTSYPDTASGTGNKIYGGLM